MAMKIPVLVQKIPGQGDTGCYFLQSNDISSNGAYLQTSEPLACGEKIQMAFIFNVPVDGQIDNFVCMSSAGTVVRSDERGIAVCFTGSYKLTSYH